MKIKEIGERGVIGLFSRVFESDRCKGLVRSIGDDCAVLESDDKNYLIASTDTILQKTHIPREMTANQIGGYAVNTVLSDIAAMGGTPQGILFSTGLPEDTPLEWLEELALGMEAAAKYHGTCIIGGDTQRADEITITGTGLGKVRCDLLMLRSNAMAGDKICVTGPIGTAAAGFHSLINSKKGFETSIKAALEPKARIKEGQLISKYSRCCMDVTDGLALSLHEIARKSGVGLRIDWESIPIVEEVRKVSSDLKVSMEELVLYKGGDYELIFTIPEDNFEPLKKELERLDSSIHMIGEITDEQGSLVMEKGGAPSPLDDRGWQAF